MNLIGNNNNYKNLKCVVRFVPIVGEYIVKIVITVSIIMMIIFSAHNGGSIVAYATSNSTVLRSSTNASSLDVLLVPLPNKSREEMHFTTKH